MNIFEKSKWIWPTPEAHADEYAEFIEDVNFYGRSAELVISSDSNYTVYVNGSLAAFGQYADYPYKKVYDKIDVSRYMRQGKNVIAFRVWYYGINTSSTYYPGKAGLIYSLFADESLLAYSSESTLSRLSPTFVPYKEKFITSQLGHPLRGSWMRNHHHGNSHGRLASSWCSSSNPQRRPLSSPMRVSYKVRPWH